MNENDIWNCFSIITDNRWQCLSFACREDFFYEFEHKSFRFCSKKEKKTEQKVTLKSATLFLGYKHVFSTFLKHLLPPNNITTTVPLQLRYHYEIYIQFVQLNIFTTRDTTEKEAGILVNYLVHEWVKYNGLWRLKYLSLKKKRFFDKRVQYGVQILIKFYIRFMVLILFLD